MINCAFWTLIFRKMNGVLIFIPNQSHPPVHSYTEIKPQEPSLGSGLCRTPLAIRISSLRSPDINGYFRNDNRVLEQKLSCADRGQGRKWSDLALVRPWQSRVLLEHRGHPRAEWKLFTSFLSFRLVNMTIMADFCSQIILQKSLTVSCLGPADRKGKCSGEGMEQIPEQPHTLPWAPTQSCVCYSLHWFEIYQIYVLMY